MVITRKIVANKIINYLEHNITLTQLIHWAENAMMDSKIEERYVDQITQIISKIGLADVKAFGLLWEDCEGFLKKLGYTIKIKIAEIG